MDVRVNIIIKIIILIKVKTKPLKKLNVFLNSICIYLYEGRLQILSFVT